MNAILMMRLDGDAAERRFQEVQEALAAGASPSSVADPAYDSAEPNATGGRAVTIMELREWRDEVLSALEASDPTSREDRDRYALRVGQVLSETLPLMQAEAAHDGVWSFLSLCLLPDVVHKRWPIENGRLSPDRWVGKQMARDRNFLKLSWRNWRAVGDLSKAASQPLGEDEMLNLLERTEVARNRELVRAIARHILAQQDFPTGRMDYTRSLMREISRWTGPLVLDIYTPGELDEFVADVGRRLTFSTGPRRRL